MSDRTTPERAAQAQDSLREQMIRVYRRACQDGEYDAADWIARAFFDRGKDA